MRTRVSSEWPWWAGALAGVALISWLGLQGFAWSDYDSEASGAFRALSAGDITGFLQQVPGYGGSLVLRAPFAAAAAALGGGELAVYRAVSIPCLLAVALLGLVVVRRMGDRGGSTGARAVVLGLCVVNPVTIRGLEMGHPEELLCAALAIGALLAAIDRRTVLAAVLLGLAIASKSWAVLAIGPVLLALAGHPRRLLALGIAGAVTAVVLAPIVLAGTEGGGGSTLVAAATTTGQIFHPWHLFWFLGDNAPGLTGFGGLPLRPGFRAAPEWLMALTHPLIVALVVPLSLGWARVHRAAPRPGGEQLLLLLALLLLLRCVLDPWNAVYYELPFLLALLCWEALCRPGRPPVLALGASLANWLTFEVAPGSLSPDMQCVFYLAWSLPLVAWLGREAFASPVRLARRERRERARPAPASLQRV